VTVLLVRGRASYVEFDLCPATDLIFHRRLFCPAQGGDPVQAAQDWFNQYGKSAVANAPRV
jgi:hypothetical protein